MLRKGKGKQNSAFRVYDTSMYAQQNIRIYLENVKMKTANESDCIGLYAPKRNIMIAVH